MRTSKSEVPTARSGTEHWREMNVNGDDTRTPGDAERSETMSETTPLLGNVSERTQRILMRNVRLLDREHLDIFVVHKVTIRSQIIIALINRQMTYLSTSL